MRVGEGRVSEGEKGGRGREGLRDRWRKGVREKEAGEGGPARVCMSVCLGVGAFVQRCSASFRYALYSRARVHACVRAFPPVAAAVSGAGCPATFGPSTGKKGEPATKG